jgi:hypothetical protein
MRRGDYFSTILMTDKSCTPASFGVAWRGWRHGPNLTGPDHFRHADGITQRTLARYHSRRARQHLIHLIDLLGR